MGSRDNLNARAEQGESPLEVSERQKNSSLPAFQNQEGKYLPLHAWSRDANFSSNTPQSGFKKRWKITRITISRSINLTFDGNRFVIELFNDMEHLHTK